MTDYRKPLVPKDKLTDSRGMPLTQSLFLECGYNTEFAVFTFNSNDKVYKGTTYKSLKKVYLEMEDPTEYIFATTHLLDWDHWQRMKANKELNEHFSKWAEELEIKLRAQAIQQIMDQAADEKGNFQAAKWLADKGWDKRATGRPKKEDKAREEAIMARVKSEFDEDFDRMSKYN